jgi:Fe-S-cluster containining protein
MIDKSKDQKKIPKDSCIRCGTCCLKGGPVLHREDKEILLSRHAGYQHLITIRKDELAFNPLHVKVEPTPRELIKVTGKGKDWSCYFYDEKGSACTIYEHRFLECRLLKCWDTSDLVSIIGKDTITRADIINPDDPILFVIETHERECPYLEINNLIITLPQETDKSKYLAKLTEFVRKDLAIRSYALSELGLKAEFESFIFGRPLFKILNACGISVRISQDVLKRYSPEPEPLLSTTFKIEQNG